MAIFPNGFISPPLSKNRIDMNYQNIVFLLLFAGLFSPNGANSQSAAFAVSGNFSQPKDKSQVTISRYDPVTQEKTALDTADISTDGGYRLQFEFAGPDLFRVDFPNRQYVMLAIAEGQSQITLDVEGGSLDSVAITGSPDSEKLLAYDRFRTESNERLIRPAYDAMRAAGETNSNPAEEIKAVEAYVAASELHRKELIDFTEKNIGSSIALFGTMLRWTGDDEVARLDKLVSGFEAAHPGLPMAKVMREKVERYQKTAIGAPAPPIAERDTAGNLVRLAEAKGKVTLIDFWASWCGPCLRQIPDLQDAYAEYHDKGFEIFGVSVDSNGSRWKASIDKYGMAWPNVSNLQGWGSEAAAAYNVTFIPFNVLLDAEGKIIAKNLHSRALQGKLAELLD